MVHTVLQHLRSCTPDWVRFSGSGGNCAHPVPPTFVPILPHPHGRGLPAAGRSAAEWPGGRRMARPVEAPDGSANDPDSPASHRWPRSPVRWRRPQRTGRFLPHEIRARVSNASGAHRAGRLHHAAPQGRPKQATMPCVWHQASTMHTQTLQGRNVCVGLRLKECIYQTKSKNPATARLSGFRDVIPPRLFVTLRPICGKKATPSLHHSITPSLQPRPLTPRTGNPSSPGSRGSPGRRGSARGRP